MVLETHAALLRGIQASIASRRPRQLGLYEVLYDIVDISFGRCHETCITVRVTNVHGNAIIEEQFGDLSTGCYMKQSVIGTV